MIDLPFIQQELAKSTYDPALGVRVVYLAKTTIGGIVVEHIAVQMDAGKGLRPHVHEHNGEIGIALTKGVMRFGTLVRDDNGNFVWEQDEVKVNWEEEISLVPGGSFEVPEGKAHDFHATESEEFLVFFILPASHLGEDRKFVVPPKK